MTNSPHQQLIYDLIDGQLSGEQLERAQQLIVDDRELAELHESLRAQQAALKQLPSYNLDSSFADRVVQEAQSQGLFAKSIQSKTTQLAAPASNRNWLAPVAAIASLAAMLLITQFIVPRLAPEMQASKTDAAVESNTEEASNENKEKEASENDGEFSPKGTSPGEVIESDVANATSDASSNMLDKQENQLADSGSTTNRNARSFPRMGSNSNNRESMASPSRGTGNSEAMPMAMAMRSDGPTEFRQSRSKPFEHQVLVFNVPQKGESIRQVNEALAENGIVAKLPAPMAEPLKNEGSGADMSIDSQEKREFAFQVRATPTQMQEVVLALRGQTNIVGVEPPSMAALSIDAQPMMAKGVADQSSADLNMKDQINENALRTQSFAARAQDAPTKKLPTDTEDAAQDLNPEMMADPVLPENVAANPQDGLKEINEFFGLASDEGQDTQTYTLIFILDREPSISPLSNELQKAAPADDRSP